MRKIEKGGKVEMTTRLTLGLLPYNRTEGKRERVRGVRHRLQSLYGGFTARPHRVIVRRLFVNICLLETKSNEQVRCTKGDWISTFFCFSTDILYNFQSNATSTHAQAGRL